MTAGRNIACCCAALLALAWALPAWSAPRMAASGAQLPVVAGAAGDTVHMLQPVTRSGREIYAEFRNGLSDQQCAADTSNRWRRHFSHVPGDLAERPERLLSLFGYVVDALREYHLPTEYALIPFVESGYRAGARSPSGPAGLWQFIAVTARNHDITIQSGYDGRLSPVESTRAAVRYLRTLHGMFAGDWRLAVMGYNAGEYRIFGALRNAGQRAMDAQPETLSVPRITHAYVRKLQALSCLLVEAGEDEQWLDSIDHLVPVLAAAPLPAGVRQIDRWAGRHGHDPALVRHFNPVFSQGSVARVDDLQVLVPKRPSDALAMLQAQAPADQPVVFLADASELVELAGAAEADAAPRTHTVVRGDSIWRLARRYGVTAAQLLLRNNLDANSVLRPGMELRIDPADPGDAPPVAN